MKHRQTNNGTLRKREVTQPQQHTEYYLFNNSQGNLKAYSDDVMSLDMNQFYNVFNPNGKNMKQQLGNLPMLLTTIPLEYSDVFDNNYRR